MLQFACMQICICIYFPFNLLCTNTSACKINKFIDDIFIALCTQSAEIEAEYFYSLIIPNYANGCMNNALSKSNKKNL